MFRAFFDPAVTRFAVPGRMSRINKIMPFGGLFFRLSPREVFNKFGVRSFLNFQRKLFRLLVHKPDAVQ